MRDINLTSLKSQRRSRRPLLLVGLLCVVFASLILIVVLFTKPEVKRPQFVEERVRLPMKSIEKEGEPRIPGVVEEEGMAGKPLEGGILEEEKPIVSESPGGETIGRWNTGGRKADCLRVPGALDRNSEKWGR